MRRRQQKPIAAETLSRGRRRRHWARTGLAGIAICLILAPGRPKADDGLPSVTVNEGSPGQAATGPNGASQQQATSAPSSMGSPQQIQPQAGPASGNAAEAPPATPRSAIAANPAAVDIVAGSGWLGQKLGLQPDSGIFLGGVWVGNGNYLFSGGESPGTSSFNSLFVADLTLNLAKLASIPGAQFGVEFLNFAGQPSNQEAGAVTGYNGLPGSPPLTRSELYELWWRQSLLDDKMIIRIGKSVPTYDFNNVTRALKTTEESLAIPAVTSLIYTPIFVNPTILGNLPGYYNSAYGVTTTVAPDKNLYLSYGIYDGDLALGDQTGLWATPRFNGYYFNIAELGGGWVLGSNRFPGSAGIGGWEQTGALNLTATTSAISQTGTRGFYTFGSQRLWNLTADPAGGSVSGFFQFGTNNSRTMLAQKYVGFGLTGFNLIPSRPADSIGGGLAWSWLNKNLGFRSDETLIQFYYQAQIVNNLYLQPVFTYVPNPGATPDLKPAAVATVQATVLF
jgi:porin